MISFICLCYNQEKSIIKLIKSIQYAHIPYEIIVIDDKSDDNSVNNIENLKDNNIKIIKLNKNINNQSYSRNLGVKLSKGNYIMYMDGDDYYNSYELNKLYNNLNNSDLISIKSIHLGKIHYITYLNFLDNEILHSITMFCINKNYLIKNNITWDENKYYVDGEDFYYTFKLLAFNPSIMYTNYYTANIIKSLNSNSLQKYINKNYIKYIKEMCLDIVLFCVSHNNINLIKYIKQYEINEINRYLGA